MQILSIGQVIYERRRELKISQEELCDGICATVTLSRLENGTRNPSARVVNALLQKLGLEENRFYAQLNPKEKHIEELRREIISRIVRFQAALEVDRPAIHAEAYQKLHALEAAAAKDDHLTAQFILRSRVLLGQENGTPYTPEEEIELLTQAMRMTVPGFLTEAEHMESRRYTLDEIKIMNQIASHYFSSGRQEEALALHSKLLTYLQEQSRGNQEVARQICLITHNYAGELRLCERYRDAAEIAELGRQCCREFGHYQLLGGLTHVLAECRHFLGQDKESIDLFQQAYCFYRFVGDDDGVARLHTDVNTYFPLLKQLTFSAIDGLFG